MGESNILGENENNSSTPMPLSPLPEVPEAVDALSGLSGAGGGRAAACEAYTQAVTETSTLMESIRTEAAAAAKSLMLTAVAARTDAITWKGHEESILERFDKQIRKTACRDARGTDECEEVRTCLAATATRLEQVRGKLELDAKTLYSAQTLLQGAPPAVEGGYSSALNAITVEATLESLNRSHLEDVKVCLAAADRIPRRICAKNSSRGCVAFVDNAAGMQVKSDVKRLISADMDLHDPIESSLKKTWCDRFDCDPTDLSKPLDALADHGEALQVFADVAPKEILAKTADASEHLMNAAKFLKTPQANDSRNLANGGLELKRASDAMTDANRAWTELKDAACKTTQLARY
jgi:hypothetical protein